MKAFVISCVLIVVSFAAYAQRDSAFGAHGQLSTDTITKKDLLFNAGLWYQVYMKTKPSVLKEKRGITKFSGRGSMYTGYYYYIFGKESIYSCTLAYTCDVEISEGKIAYRFYDFQPIDSICHSLYPLKILSSVQKSPVEFKFLEKHQQEKVYGSLIETSRIYFDRLMISFVSCMTGYEPEGFLN